MGNHKENTKISCKNIEEKSNSKGTAGSVGFKTAVEIPCPEQPHSKTQGSILLEAHANKIKPLMNTGLDNIRFQRGRDIASKKNQIVEVDESRYIVKSQSNCGEYEVISTELGWRCSCADHRSRNVTCKHIFAIFSTLKRKLEAESQDYDGYVVEFDAVAISKPREMTKEVNQDQTRLTEEKEMNQNLLTQVVDYEQELYDKDQYIEVLKNEISRLMGHTHYLREKIL
jgi:hypothetical protein